MAETTQETGANGTNGTTPNGAKVDSVITKFEKDWKERTKGKMPDAKRIKELKANLQKAVDAETAAVKAQEEARKLFDAASETALNELGRKNVSLDGGVLLTPSSRGDKVYYKKMTHEDAI